jgi:hypothetical protein
LLPPWLTAVVFSFTLFVSAALLFIVELLIGKTMSPLLGGTPAVWNTCMVFFQAVLLAGYAYAHVSSHLLGARKGAVLHLVVLALPVPLLLLLFRPGVVLPELVAGWEGNPIPGLLLALTLVVGLPMFVVCSSAPLLQKWFSSTDHPAGSDPYFIFAASNLGSMVGLLSYPLLIEPFLTLAGQRLYWTLGFVVLAGLTATCAWLLWRSRPAPALALAGIGAGAQPEGPAAAPLVASAPAGAIAPGRPTGLATTPGVPGPGVVAPPAAAASAVSEDEADDRERPVTLMRRLGWVALAFVPSSLMLGVTTYMTLDVAAIPLLWVLPLALYLLSFVIVFAPPLVRAVLVSLLVVPALLWATGWWLAPLVFGEKRDLTIQFVRVVCFVLWPLLAVGLVLPAVLARRRNPTHASMVLLMPLMVLLIVFVMLLDWSRVSFRDLGIVSKIGLHLATLFVVSMVCHGQLAHDRPSPRYLTGYFLLLSLGGVLGGLFNALVAPLVFRGVVEYPVALVLAGLLLPPLFAWPEGKPWRVARWGLRFLSLALAVGLAVAGGRLFFLHYRDVREMDQTRVAVQKSLDRTDDLLKALASHQAEVASTRTKLEAVVTTRKGAAARLTVLGRSLDSLTESAGEAASQTGEAAAALEEVTRHLEALSDPDRRDMDFSYYLKSFPTFYDCKNSLEQRKEAFEQIKDWLGTDKQDVAAPANDATAKKTARELLLFLEVYQLHLGPTFRFPRGGPNLVELQRDLKRLADTPELQEQKTSEVLFGPHSPWKWTVAALGVALMLVGLLAWHANRGPSRAKGAPAPNRLIDLALDLALPLALALLVVGLYWGLPSSALKRWVTDRAADRDLTASRFRNLLIFGLPCLLCFAFVGRSLRFGLSLGAIFLAATYSNQIADPPLYQDRSFFGVLKVEERTRKGTIEHNRRLVHGSTLHGIQYLFSQEMRETPRTYYHRTGPIGRVFEAFNKREIPVGLIGLGTGTMACYGLPADRGPDGRVVAPGQRMDFYDIDPVVVRLSGPGGQFFQYCDDALVRGLPTKETPAPRGAKAKQGHEELVQKREELQQALKAERKVDAVPPEWRGVNLNFILGDARLTFDREKKKSGFQKYSILVVDAFSSDAIPVHLITRDALLMFMDGMREDGVVCYHISNRYLDLAPVLSNLVEKEGYHAYHMSDDDELFDSSDFRWRLRQSWRRDHINFWFDDAHYLKYYIDPRYGDYTNAALLDMGKSRSHWVVIARERRHLLPLLQRQRVIRGRNQAHEDATRALWSAQLPGLNNTAASAVGAAVSVNLLARTELSPQWRPLHGREELRKRIDRSTGEDQRYWEAELRARDRAGLWTDDYSNLLGVFMPWNRWRDRRAGGPR